jgi:hypothetical protein
MQFRALSFGAVLGFAILAVSSCQCGGPPTGRCGPNNCEGCCTVMGECVPLANTTDMACGNQGIVCSNCATMGQTCNKTTNSCIGNIAGGGSAAGGSAAGGTAGSMGGGAAAGGSAGGMSGLMPCDIMAPACPSGTQCLPTNSMSMNAAHCVPGACDVVRQDCSDPNSKCFVGFLPDGGFGRQCVPVSGPDGGLPDSAGCTPAPASDPCQRGSQCIGFTNTATLCRRYCGPMTQCGGTALCGGAVAFTLQSGSTNEIHPLCTATTACNPLDQAPCGAAEACQISMVGPICVRNGTQTAGQACSDMMFCSRGTACIVGSGGASMGTCRNFCNVDGGMPTCAAGMCQPLIGASVGACSM